ncbi:MAG: penicillin-binding protein activator [Saccharospirillum sp.]
MYLSKTPYYLAVVMGLVLLAGCAGQPQRDDLDFDSDQYATVEDQRLAQASDLLDDYRTDEAEVVLSTLAFESLTTEQQTRYAELRGELALQRGDGLLALEWLAGDYAYLFDGLPMERQAQIRFKRAEAYEFAGEYLAAVRDRVFLSVYLEGERAEYNQEQIWFNLQLVPEESIRQLIDQDPAPELTGWLELALISRENVNDVRQQVVAIDGWINRNPRHPAALTLPGDLQLLRQLVSEQPRNIAVLLPFTGPLERAGLAIRSGLLAAWYEAERLGRDTPDLTFYDTELTPDILALYQQAVLDGADLVIGPLEKNRVERFQSQEVLSIPVLALNYADNRAAGPANFYQFGLAPEDEARQVAEQAWIEGHRRALVLTPAGDWGTRVGDAFIRHWETQGGTIASRAQYDQPDQYLNVVKRALNIHDSEQRHRNLVELAGQSIEFEPRRRQDIDLVFMVALPAQGRQLKPVLNFQYAQDLPVMATSHLYSGSVSPERDNDLNGIAFVEMPWKMQPPLIASQLQRAFGEQYAGFDTLLALGVDAYRLYPRLPQLQRFPDSRVYGTTGTLRLNASSRIERELLWAEFRDGRAQPRTTTIDPSALGGF